MSAKLKARINAAIASCTETLAAIRSAMREANAVPASVAEAYYLDAIQQ